MTKGIVRFISALLAMMLLCMASGVVFAETEERKKNTISKDDVPESAFVYTYTLKVYYKPTKSSDILERVPFAKEIVRLSVKKGWAKVMTTNGRIGYCNNKQLTKTDPNNLDVYMYCQQKRPEVYYRPTTSAPVMGHLNRDEKVHVVAMTPMGDWLRIEEDGYHGYIQRPCLDYEKYSTGQHAWVSAEKLEVYYDPEINSVFGTLYFGQTLSLVESSGRRAKVRSGSGLVGYCDINGLTTVNPNSMNMTVYTQVPGEYLFVTSTDESGRRSVSANEEMMLDAVDGNNYWARVRYKGEYYYVPYVFLGTEKRGGGDYKIVYTTEALHIKEGTKQSSEVVATVAAGTPLMLIGATDYHAKVAMMPNDDGVQKTGYVEVKYLR